MARAWRGFGCAECTLSLDSTPPMQSLPRRPAQMPLQAPFREQFSDLEAALYSKTPTHSLYFIEHRRAVPLRLLRRHDLGHYAATLGDDGGMTGLSTLDQLRETCLGVVHAQLVHDAI